MGTAQSRGGSVCASSGPVSTKDEYRLPWALAQKMDFDSEECPFCALRRSHCNWLQTEIKRLTSEVASIETTIPERLRQDLNARLQVEMPLSPYTGGVEDVVGESCPKCQEHRSEVRSLQKEANSLDSHCKARINFHREFAQTIEEMLVEKRNAEETMFLRTIQHGGEEFFIPEDDRHFCAITKVNTKDDDVAPNLMNANTLRGNSIH